MMKSVNLALLNRNHEQYFMIIENDAVHVQYGWLDKVLNLFYKDKSIGCIGVKPPIIDRNEEVFPIYPDLPLEETYALPFLTTVSSPDVMDELGFYAEFYPWTGPDYDWGMRVIKAGYKCGYYCSERTNTKDYIEIEDLGRNDNEVLVEGVDYHNKKQAQDRQSMEIVGVELQKILNGQRDILEDTCMRKFKKYEEL